MSKYGLRKKPTYDSLIDYIQNEQPNIKYPNRLATQITNSREMTKLDGLGMVGLEQQQLDLGVERQRQNQISELATREGTTAKHVRTLKPPAKKQPEPTFFDLSSDSNKEGFMDDIEEILNEEDTKKTAKATDVMRQVVDSLVGLVPSQQDFAHRMASVASSSTSFLIPNYTNPPAITGLLFGPNTKPPAPADLLIGPRPLPPYMDPADVDPANPFAMPKAKSPPILNLTLPTPKPKAKYLASITAVPKTPKAKARPLALTAPPAITEPPVPTPKTKARNLAITAPPTATPKPKAKSKVTPIKQLGVEMIDNNDKKFWAKQNISVLKEQAQLRGYKFTDMQTKGGYNIVLGKKIKQKGLRKADYLDIFFQILDRKTQIK
jgi:hypothetical protein